GAPGPVGPGPPDQQGTLGRARRARLALPLVPAAVRRPLPGDDHPAGAVAQHVVDGAPEDALARPAPLGDAHHDHLGIDALRLLDDRAPGLAPAHDLRGHLLAVLLRDRLGWLQELLRGGL